jgi:tetratricopeptide (TPR) repeat protein
MDLNALHRVPSLEALPDRQLAHLARTSSWTDYDAGQVIARGYRLRDLLFFVGEGTVEIFRLAAGDRTLIARLHSSQFFYGANSDTTCSLPMIIQAAAPTRLLILNKQAVQRSSSLLPSGGTCLPAARVVLPSIWAKLAAFCFPSVLAILLLSIFLIPSLWHIMADLDYGFAGWLLSQGDVEGARNELKSTLTLDPNYAAAYNDLGYFHYQRGEWEDALGAFHTATSANPDFSVAYNNLGLTYLALGREQEALAALQRATYLNPEDALAFNHLGLALQRLGQVAEAEESFRNALRIDPRLKLARANLAVLYFNQGRRSEAVQQAQIVLDMDSSISQMHLIIGADALARHDYGLAHNYLREAMSLPSSDPAAGFYYRLLPQQYQ